MIRRPRTARRLAAAGAAVLALALSGCVRMGLELELAPDDVARPSLVLGVEDQVLEDTGQSAEAFIDTIVGGNDPADTAVSVEEWAGDGYTGERYVYGDLDVSEVGTATSLPVNVVREGDEYVVSGTLDLTASGLGLGGGASLDDVDVVIDITFPGPVTESNGTIRENTVHWDPPLGGQYEIHARGSAVVPSTPSPTPGAAGSEPGGTTSGVPDWIVLVIGVGGLVILLLLAIVVWQALRVRRRDDAGPAGGPPPYPHQPPYPPHPYPPQGYAQPGYPPPGQAHPQQDVTPITPNRPPSIPPHG